MRFFRAIWLAFFCSVLLSACGGSRGGSIPYDVKGFDAPDAPTALSGSATYKLAPLDVVSISVFQVPDLSRDYPVDVAGNITMPLIGPVQAIGLNTIELGSSIQQRLGERYLSNPNVTVALKESPTRVVTVEGSVKNPGVVPVVGSMTLLQAIAMARGLDDLANPRRVAVFRQLGGKRQAAAFDLTSIRRGESPDPQIYAGDVVIVDGSGLKKAQKDIFQSLPFLSIFTAIP